MAVQIGELSDEQRHRIRESTASRKSKDEKSSSFTRLETEELYSILGLETLLLHLMRWCAVSSLAVAAPAGAVAAVSSLVVVAPVGAAAVSSLVAAAPAGAVAVS